MKKLLLLIAVTLACSNKTVTYAALTVGGVTWSDANAGDYYYTFDEAQYACPAGWRLPTRQEFAALDNLGSSWANANARGNSVAGRFYGRNHATCTMNNLEGCIFMPALGYLFDSMPLSHGKQGNYWSSTPSDISGGYQLRFFNSASFPAGLANKASEFCVRCVK